MGEQELAQLRKKNKRHEISVLVGKLAGLEAGMRCIAPESETLNRLFAEYKTTYSSLCGVAFDLLDRFPDEAF